MEQHIFAKMIAFSPRKCIMYTEAEMFLVRRHVKAVLLWGGVNSTVDRYSPGDRAWHLGYRCSPHGGLKFPMETDVKASDRYSVGYWG